jgi:hypothetical protein
MTTFANSILDFADLEDFRIERNRIHPLINIVSIAILGVICGADTWVDTTALFVSAKPRIRNLLRIWGLDDERTK